MNLKLPLILVAVAVVLAVHLPAHAADPSGFDLAPLTDEQRKVLYGSAEDTLDKEACEGTRKKVTLTCRDKTSYITTNEWYHQIWRPYIEGIRGAYVGVAGDQGLTFIAWARSEIAFMMDYDPQVVRINYVHTALVKHSKDIASFVARWQKGARKQTLALLEQEYKDHPDRKRIVRAYRIYARSMTRHWKRVLKRTWSRSHWLHDPAWYSYLHALINQGRLRVIKGDLLKEKSLRGIGAITHELKIPMRVIYTSNAEEFWPYPKNFRDNIGAMLMDDKSVVLRTRHSDKYGPRIGAYVYIVQDGQHFQAKLKDRKYRGMWVVMRDRKAGRKGFFTIGPVEQVKPESPRLTPPRRKRSSKGDAS